LKSRLCSPIFAVRSEAIVAARLWPVAALVLGRNPVFHLRSTTIGRRDVQKFPMTAPGLQRLSDELRQLKAEERPSIIRQIAEARTHGDLSENAEYHAARERQSFIEGRIAELEEIVSSVEVIDPSSLSGEHIMFGAHVRLVEEDTEKESAYQIVGVYEADIKSGKLSISSPLAKALIGKRVGDAVSVPAPGGDRSYEILSFKFI
jgi:transcription elongation factor GreA